MQTPRFEISEEVRGAASRSVDQAREAFERFLEAARKAAVTAEGSAKSLGENTADFSRQALALVEQTVATSFQLVQRLARAPTIAEMTALQREFLRRQMEAIASKSGKADRTEAKSIAAAMPAPPRSKSRSQKRSPPKSATKKSKRKGERKRKT